jgi:hypothetical protein
MSPEKTGGSPILCYVIERCEISSNATLELSDQLLDKHPFKWIRHDTVDKYTLDYTLHNLVLGGLYSIRVSAQNLAGTGPYAEITEPVTARNKFSVPDRPVGPITITNITRQTADAAWHAPKYDGGSPLTSYFIEKKDANDSFWIKIARVDPDIRFLKIINIVEGNEYHIRVIAENEHGQSEPLVSDSFKPLRIHGN